MGGAPLCRSASGVFDDGPALADRLEDGIDSLIRILDGKPLAFARVPTVVGSWTSSQ
jgi:hypothetical protein